MDVEYTISPGKKIFYGVFSIFIACGALFLLSTVFTHPEKTGIAVPFCVALFFLAILIGGQIRKKVIISTDHIVGINVLQRKELSTANVKGCRIGTKTIIIEPISTPGPKIIINNYADFDDNEDLTKWLKENFKDLDTADLETEHKKVLSDVALGATTEQREAKIAKSKWTAGIYNAVGVIIGLGSIPFDKQLPIVIIVILYPLLGILIMATSSGLIKFLSNPKRSVYSFAFIGLMTPSIALCLCASLGYNIDDYQHGLLLALIICLPITASFYLTGLNKDLPSIFGQLTMMLIISLVYGYGTIIKINCMFDKTAPQIIQTSVSDLDITQNKGTHYYLWLKSWDADQNLKEIEVSSTTFYRYHVGSIIDVRVKKGLLNIPWYYL